MKIALLGYGKMGRMVEAVCLRRGHEVTMRVSADGDKMDMKQLKSADMAIDFSAPDAVMAHIYQCFDADVPVVVGTTGWYGELQEVKNTCLKRNKSILYGSNFSVGVNLFFSLNRYLARLMNNMPNYDVQIEEIHHTAKLDSPSGTAMTLAEDIIDVMDRKTEWINVLTDKDAVDTLREGQLLIESQRINDVPGTHSVIYGSEIDNIEIKHTAHSREGFALGAVLAAEWLENKQGFYSVNDVFRFEKDI